MVMIVCGIIEPDELVDHSRELQNRYAERAVSAFNSQIANGFPRFHPLRWVVIVKGIYT